MEGKQNRLANLSDDLVGRNDRLPAGVGQRDLVDPVLGQAPAHINSGVEMRSAKGQSRPPHAHRGRSGPVDWIQKGGQLDQTLHSVQQRAASKEWPERGWAALDRAGRVAPLHLAEGLDHTRRLKHAGRTVKSDQQGGGILRGHLGGAAAALGGLNETGLSHRAGHVVDQHPVAAIDLHQSIHKRGQSSHAGLLSSFQGRRPSQRSNLNIIHKADQLSTQTTRFYPEFDIVLTLPSGAIRNLSPFVKLWLYTSRPARSPSAPSGPKSVRETFGRSKGRGAGSSPPRPSAPYSSFRRG